jgi:cellobiose PTS system EIIB component
VLWADVAVSKQCSIADAKRNLAGLVSEVEAGAEVLLTRDGQPVAVLVSLAEHARSRARRDRFAEKYREFRERFPDAAPGIGPRYFRVLRDRHEGRKVEL